MSLNSKDRAHLTVEVLEGRELPSSVLPSTLPTTTAPVTTAPTGNTMQVSYGAALATAGTGTSHTYAYTYAVLSLRNTTRAAVHFEFRWASNKPWTKYTLAAGASYYLWVYGFNPAPQVRFDADPATGVQASQPNNLHFKAVTQVGAPTYAQAFHYAIARTGNTLSVTPSAS